MSFRGDMTRRQNARAGEHQRPGAVGPVVGRSGAYTGRFFAARQCDGSGARSGRDRVHYVGFAVADGRPRVIAVESSVAAAFVIVGAAAVTGSPWLLVVGLAGHGFSDLWQHRTHPSPPRWWPPPRSSTGSLRRGSRSRFSPGSAFILTELYPRRPLLLGWQSTGLGR